MKKYLLVVFVLLIVVPIQGTAHIPEECMSKFSKMNGWIAPKKTEAERLGSAGEKLSAMVPASVRLALVKGEPVEWAPDMDELARILDTVGSAAHNYLASDSYFTDDLGDFLVCIVEH